MGWISARSSPSGEKILYGLQLVGFDAVDDGALPTAFGADVRIGVRHQLGTDVL